MFSNSSNHRTKFFANLATYTILKIGLILHLWKLQQSKVQKEVLKLVPDVMEWFMRLKKL